MTARQEISRIDELLKFHRTLWLGATPGKKPEHMKNINYFLDRRNILSKQASHENQ